jgi:hypothetical protein
MKIFTVTGFIIWMAVFSSCDSKNSLDCFQSAGDIVQEEFTVLPFKKIQVWERVQLFVSTGETQSVRVETGENLMNEILLKVEDSLLTIADRNSCNFTRDYAVTKVYVTTPELEQIRNSSGFAVESIGVLKFPFLDLVSTDLVAEGVYHIDGDFRLNLDVNWLNVNANGLSKFYLTGRTWGGFFGLWDGDVRIEAEDLDIQKVLFFHRSSNKFIINPQQDLIGEIRGVGDVISLNHPPTIEVEQFFTGRLIFQ